MSKIFKIGLYSYSGPTWATVKANTIRNPKLSFNFQSPIVNVLKYISKYWDPFVYGQGYSKAFNKFGVTTRNSFQVFSGIFSANSERKLNSS